MKRKILKMFKKTFSKTSLLAPLLALLLIPSFLLNIFFFQKVKKEESGQGLLVVEVLDGDTLLMEGDTRVRLRGVDAPELKFCDGLEAKNELLGLVKNKRVKLEEQIIDQWGRPMALVYLGDKLINEEILKVGLARFHSDNTTQRQRLKNAYDNAQKKKLGIFSAKCEQTTPADPKCVIKGNIDKNSTRRNYYLPGCAQYKFTIVEKDTGEDWFCTETQAVTAGFTKALTCP